MQALALGLALLPVAGLAAWWLWLRDRRQRADGEARLGAEVDAAISEFRARASLDAGDHVAAQAQIIEQELAREKPNADLGRDRAAVRERLLRAARDAGGDEARAELEELLDAQHPGDAAPR